MGSSLMTKLCLGTAQFGMNYGVKNYNGKVDITEVQEILDEFYSSGYNQLDTAAGYGNAEEILGSVMGGKHFSITTKIQSSRNSGCIDISELDSMVDASRSRLNRERLDTLLLHDSSCLNGKDKKTVAEWISRLKMSTRVGRVGVSIYKAEELHKINMVDIDVIQLPLSLYNQELKKNRTIHMLKEIGIEIQVRSVFLQGLLLSSGEELPDWLSENFRRHHDRWLSMVNKAGRSQLEVALGFIKSIEFIDTLVLGVDSLKQLKGILNAWQDCETVPLGLISTEWDWPSRIELDPRYWPR